MCARHRTHIQGPGGKKNSARLREVTELECLSTEERKNLSRREDRLALLLELRGACGQGDAAARTDLDTALGRLIATSARL